LDGLAQSFIDKSIDEARKNASRLALGDCTSQIRRYKCLRNGVSGWGMKGCGCSKTMRLNMSEEKKKKRGEKNSLN